MSFMSDTFDVMRAMGYYHHSAEPLAWIHPGESCVGPSWFARSNPNTSNRIITSHPRPIPHIFSAPWTQKGEFALVACPKPDSTRHIPLALAHANIKNLLILRPPPKHNYVKRTFGSFFHWCTGTVLCLLVVHFIGEIGPDDGPPVTWIAKLSGT